jgi:hypothetical protein
VGTADPMQYVDGNASAAFAHPTILGWGLIAMCARQLTLSTTEERPIACGFAVAASNRACGVCRKHDIDLIKLLLLLYF